ncbi:hypothetical protein AURDEDRAFT_171088 [Auricularia subglabra TFB-10046 SS5]|nr:hypothetical protein AURDEDRAFT_171088 [Auricularia subglabra TFB-10046 SS5]
MPHQTSQGCEFNPCPVLPQASADDRQPNKARLRARVHQRSVLPIRRVTLVPTGSSQQRRVQAGMPIRPSPVPMPYDPQISVAGPSRSERQKVTGLRDAVTVSTETVKNVKPEHLDAKDLKSADEDFALVSGEQMDVIKVSENDWLIIGDASAENMGAGNHSDDFVIV